MQFIDEHTRFFMDASWGFGEVPSWFQVIPGPGEWKHPEYGQIKITKEDLEEFAQNFEEGVYQEHIPIDAEHETKLSGACGYYAEVKVGGPKGEPGLWARANWTDRGEKLLEEEKYKYFSPEWYDSWTDPATEKVYKNVLVGGAMTTHPFFKDPSLRPLVASEGYVWSVEDENQHRWEEIEPVEANEPDVEAVHVPALIEKFQRGGKGMGEISLKLTTEQVEAIAKGETIEFTEEQLEEIKATEKASEEEVVKASEASPEVTRQFADMNKKLAEGENALRAANEEIAKMKTSARRRTFQEFIKANRAAFQGEVDENVTKLEKLASHLPEDVFNEVLEEKKSLHERVMASGIFTQVTKESVKPADAKGEIDTLVAELVKGGLEQSAAISKVAGENPELYARYRKEHNAKARSG